MNRVCIPDSEYQQRIQKAAVLAGEMGLDALVVSATESDYANARYFSGFWPLFERAGVAITPSGKAALLVGPESAVFAADFGKIDTIIPMLAYRESANPSYPEFSDHSFRDVFRRLGVTGEALRIGIASIMDTTIVIRDAIAQSFPKATIVDATDIMVRLRSVKSENEIACLREGFRIVRLATQEVIRKLRPGVTELQMVGVAQQTIYENGAEYEGLPMYIFSEKSTRHAISRSSYREIQKGDVVQLNLSAKIDGYSPSIGLPVCMGKLSDEKRRYVEFCLEAHRWTERQLRAGAVASDIAKGHYQLYVENGFRDAYVYGPCHGTGMIEVEAPWMETNTDYCLQENMTFQIDTFVSGPTFGIRWEKGVAIRADGCEILGDHDGVIVELDF